MVVLFLFKKSDSGQYRIELIEFTCTQIFPTGGIIDGIAGDEKGYRTGVGR